ncbi:hypothetical protein, partial [Ruminococcus sp.]|uniref:hypothetical protein n=1 Tax=Ruminococcus sp. TaxID=41978 RepID=UPI003AB8D4E1
MFLNIDRSGGKCKSKIGKTSLDPPENSGIFSRCSAAARLICRGAVLYYIGVRAEKRKIRFRQRDESQSVSTGTVKMDAIEFSDELYRRALVSAGSPERLLRFRRMVA